MDVGWGAGREKLGIEEKVLYLPFFFGAILANFFFPKFFFSFRKPQTPPLDAPLLKLNPSNHQLTGVKAPSHSEHKFIQATYVLLHERLITLYTRWLFAIICRLANAKSRGGGGFLWGVRWGGERSGGKAGP